MSLKVGGVVLDATDVKRATAFWSGALGYKVAYESEDWVSLKDPDGHGVAIGLQPNPDPKTDVNRAHLDLYTAERDAEIARLEGLGAKRVPWEYEPDSNFTVLVDTEGNEFCIVERRAPT